MGAKLRICQVNRNSKTATTLVQLPAPTSLVLASLLSFICCQSFMCFVASGSTVDVVSYRSRFMIPLHASEVNRPRKSAGEFKCQERSQNARAVALVLTEAAQLSKYSAKNMAARVLNHRSDNNPFKNDQPHRILET